MTPMEPRDSSQVVRVARHLMATRFEVLLYGADPVSLRAIGEEVLDEIQSLEKRLSYYDPQSVISQINREAARRPVRVDPIVFEVLLASERLWKLTEGAFDVTSAALTRCWGFAQSAGQLPGLRALAEAFDATGMHHVELDSQSRTVRFHHPETQIDLGSIGKGFALDQSSLVFAELGVENVLIHGGSSSALGLGTAPTAKPWRVAIDPPSEPEPSGRWKPEETIDMEAVSGVVDLSATSLSVSAASGKGFTSEGDYYGHILDPRSGEPTRGPELAAVVSPSAAETDAVATALMVSGRDGAKRILQRRPDIRGFILDTEGRFEVGD